MKHFGKDHRDFQTKLVYHEYLKKSALACPEID